MLADISWGVYLTSIIILLVLYYGYLIFRFYRGKLEYVLKCRFRTERSYICAENRENPFAEFSELFETLEDAEELYDKLLECITESNDRGFSKTVFENHLRFILSEYPFVKQSALRSKINSLLISESGEYPELALTYAEMDRLWEEEE